MKISYEKKWKRRKLFLEKMVIFVKQYYKSSHP